MSLTLPMLLLLIVGAILLLFALFLLIRRGVLGILVRSILPLILLVFSIVLIFSGFDMMSYHQLLKESAAGTVHFEKNSPQTYTATLITDDQNKHYFQLKGDQWQIDARVIRWHPSLARIGFKTIYRMERISGRYHSIHQELHAERTVYPIVLSGSFSRYLGSGIDIWAQLKQMSWLQQWVDASYGSATYVPMVDGAVYEVKMGYSGLSAHPVNTASREAVTAWQ